eukprot:TRINITY_DN1020_c0_g1_i1.p1 TRINITY_DN1020_c0_g1~~TRINITY_DN1020_c0_g1_i1.p1  ORF type:complete len:443 (+),score=137.90 TRINITY_DN1020_c0_g1_i1:58-1329(+)
MGRTKQTPRKKKSNQGQNNNNKKKEIIKKQKEQLEQVKDTKQTTPTPTPTLTPTHTQQKQDTPNRKKRRRSKQKKSEKVEKVAEKVAEKVEKEVEEKVEENADENVEDVVMTDVQSFVLEKKAEREKSKKKTNIYADPRVKKVSVPSVNGKRPSLKKRKSALRKANRELIEEYKAPELDKELGVPVHDVLDIGQVYRAAEAVLDLDKKKEQQNVEKRVLFEDPDLIQMIITLNKIPQKNRRAPHLIDLPNPLLVGDVDICIFVKDPSKEQKQYIKDMMIPNVKKIIGIKSLREKYSRFEARKKLADSYDIFLCDENISMVLPKLLGKIFFQDKKYPAPIKINSYLPERIERAVSSTQLHISQGPCLNVRIGNTEMTAKELSENIIMSINQIATRLPDGKWNNIRSLALKLPKSTSLPFYIGPQ